MKSLKQQIGEYKDKVFQKFEQLLIEAARTISDRYIQIGAYLRRSLKTPEDVEAMDKFVSDVQNERIQIKTKTTEIFVKVMFLLK